MTEELLLRIFNFLIAILILIWAIRNLLERWKVSDLDKIAKQGISYIGFFSEESIYEAFLNAGLSEEKAREEAKKRAWHID